jgi:AAA domain-containing protein
MTIDLKKITQGKQAREPRICLYGADGVGKTQFAAGAPDPFFIDLNRGSLQYDVKRVIPESWGEAIEWVNAVDSGSVKCKTLVIDSITDLEYLGHVEFLQGIPVDKWDGGYGHGDNYALMKWRELFSPLERIWNSGKTIIFIGHMTVRSFTDPQGPSYDRYEMAVRKNIAGLIRQQVDYVLFAKEGITQQKVAGDMKAVATGARWIHTSRSPAFDAKSRGATLFPEMLPLSWSEFNRERLAEDARISELNKEIDVMLKEISDKAYESVVREWMRGNPNAIVDSRNRVAARLEESRAKKSSAPTPQPTA